MFCKSRLKNIEKQLLPHSIKKLNMSYNILKKVDFIEELANLTHLNLRHNKLKVFKMNIKNAIK